MFRAHSASGGGRLLPGLLAAALGLASAGCGSDPEEIPLRDVSADLEAREEQRAEATAAIVDESGGLMPDMLEGVALGMPIAALRAQRPEIRIDPGLDRADPGTRLYEERLENGARVAYVVDTNSERLQRVQVLSQLPDANAIAPHLAAMDTRYGTPTGVWDCPDTGGVPTRRFTWRHARTTVSDVFLRYGDRVAVTLYIAPTPVIAESLRRARCTPATRENLDRFPIATPAQMQAGQQ